MDIIVEKILFPLLSVVITTAITALCRKYFQKVGIEVEDSVIKQAVHYAEEKALEFYKKFSTKMPSSEKLDTAVKYVWQAIPATQKAAYQEQLTAKIEAKVNEALHYSELSRAPGAGSRDSSLK